MSDLSTKLRAALEFNSAIYPIHDDDDLSLGRLIGAQDEYLRLKPLHSQLIACVEALEKTTNIVLTDEAYGACRFSFEDAREALARLEEIIK